MVKQDKEYYNHKETADLIKAALWTHKIGVLTFHG